MGYPKIISQVIEEPPRIIDGVEYPADYNRPNPNGELDNLYLDMNGIVHPCTHPEGRPAPETEDEMMLEVFRYTDRVVSMARPRKVLMMAVDGVAPRAKMNQQRSRRFRAAQDAKIQEEAKEKAIEEAEARGETIDMAIKGKKAWDSNAITPGTPFMDILAISLRYWVAYKLNNDPGWKDLKVIISDAMVPGEGEHKIMEFIRSQRSDPSYNPNTSHCIYGLDADLIFLGLATHEPHFRILREDVFAQDNRKKKGSAFALKQQSEEEKDQQAEQESKKPFIWLHIDILREYLEIELAVPRLSFDYDFERAIDDWVFMGFFVGNDFLPHLPSLDVRENGIDTLLGIWKRSLNEMKGFMTLDGQVDLKRVEILLRGIGSQEDFIFRKKRDQELRRQENEKRRKLEREETKLNKMGPPPAPLSKNRGERAPIHPLENMPLYSPSGESVGETHMSNSELVARRNEISLANMSNKSAAQELKAELLKAGSQPSTADETPAETPESTVESGLESEFEEPGQLGEKRRAKAPPIKEDNKYDEPEDNIRLWEPGYRDRYYHFKFHVEPDDKEFRKQVVSKYIEGVCWVLLYYYQGCPSWNWFYPYHYAPFAADMTDIGDLKIEFTKGIPFRPYEQLMSVLPAASNTNLPEVFRSLMSDPDSEIIEFYPEDFPIDMNGKKMSWQGIALLPFIDEVRLLAAVHKKYSFLTDEEHRRNERKDDILLISSQSTLYKFLREKLYGEAPRDKVHFASDQGDGLAGTALRITELSHDKLDFPLNVGEYPDIDTDQSLTVEYLMPKSPVYHKSMLLSGLKMPEPVLTVDDKEAIRYGRRGGNGYGGNGYSDSTSSSLRHGKSRPGGYRNFTETYRSGGMVDGGRGGYNRDRKYGHNENNPNYSRGYGQDYNQGYNGDGRGGYNQGYGQNYGQNYNQGYNQRYPFNQSSQSYSHGYGQGGYQGYNRGGYNQGGYNQGGYNQGGYNQGGYNQGGYNQGYNPGYNQSYNQSYNQGYNQGYGQGAYNQGYNQGGYNQSYNQGYGQGDYGQGQNQQYGQGNLLAPNRSSTYSSRGRGGYRP